MMSREHYVVYWIGKIHYARWVNSRKFNELRKDPAVKFSSVLKA